MAGRLRKVIRKWLELHAHDFLAPGIEIVKHFKTHVETAETVFKSWFIVLKTINNKKQIPGVLNILAVLVTILGCPWKVSK